MNFWYIIRDKDESGERSVEFITVVIYAIARFFHLAFDCLPQHFPAEDRFALRTRLGYFYHTLLF